MTREELLKCPEYWTSLIQDELYRQINIYMEEHKMNKTELAKHLGCSRGYVTQLLNGDFDHKLSKLVELSLAIGMAPSIKFNELEHVDDAIKFECKGVIDVLPRMSVIKNTVVMQPSANYEQSIDRFTQINQLNKLVS